MPNLQKRELVLLCKKALDNQSGPFICYFGSVQELDHVRVGTSDLLDLKSEYSLTIAIWLLLYCELPLAVSCFKV